MTGGDAIDYSIPGGNRIALSDQLAEQIRNHLHKDRENRFQLYLLAAGLRKKYKGKAKEGDKKASGFSSEFDDWYKKNKLDELIGSAGNFSKYASAGEVVAHVASKTSDPDKYIKQLPTGVGVLYEISQILRKSEDDFDLCLHFTTKRKSVASPKGEWDTKRPPLINPRATEAAVRQWHREWFKPPPPKVKRTDKRTVNIAKIYVSGELFDFDKKTGEKVGCVDLPDIEKFIDKINSLFTAENELQFRLEYSMEALEIQYFRWREKSDPAKNIISRSVRPSKSKPIKVKRS